MTHSPPRSHSPIVGYVAWAALALAAGLVLARLRPEISAALVVGIALCAAAVWEPALGLGLAIILGPAKAYLAVAWPGVPSDPGQVFFALAAAGWLARGLARREIFIPRIGLLLPLGLYVAAGLFSLLAAQSLQEGLKESVKWVEIGLGAVILVSEAGRGRLKWIIAAILTTGLLQAAIGLWQYEFQTNGPAHFRVLGDHFRAYGTFEQPNPYGGFLGIVWPSAAGLAVERLREASRTRKASSLLPLSFFLLAALAMLVGLYVSFSRGAWMGAGVAALAVTAALPRRWITGLGLVVVVIAAAWSLARSGLLPTGISARLADIADFATVTDVRGVNIDDANFSIVERLAHWQAAEAMARAYPWWGVGLGNFAAAYPSFRLLNWPNALGHAHMIYLNVLAETGAAGLVTYVILWSTIIGLTMRIIGRRIGTPRGMAVGLLGAWVHLSAHQVVDNLYVNNIHFTIAALLSLLIYLSRPPFELPQAGTHQRANHALT